MMSKFPCTDCPVYVMCKNKLHTRKNPSAFGLCSLLNNYLLMSKDNVVYRINMTRDFFDLKSLDNNRIPYDY